MATILVVDDRPANRDFLVTLLGYKANRLLQASDGAEALALVRAQRPDLVIADMLMPTMDGYELVRQMRSEPAIAHTPVVFCTAHYLEREALALAHACGVAHVLFKPCEPEVVLRTVDAALGLPQPLTPALPEEFDREHLRLVTQKLSQQAEALTVANDELREADRRKDEFLAMLAHELRNPLASILNAAQVMRLRSVGDPSLEPVRDTIERQALHMSRLLDDLLDVSRITRGKIELQRQPLDLASVLADAVQASRPLIDSRRHQLFVSLPAKPLRVEGDATRLAQVLANLLNNAAKYTEPDGRIWLSAEPQENQAVLRVRDSGVGIAPEMLARVFDLFVQVDHSLARSNGGLGIGLTLVRSLVEMQRGTVTAHSAGLGHGSEFVVRLPLAIVPEDAGETAPQPPQSTGRRIVLIEDNPDVRDMLRQLLALSGHDVQVAEDGPRGLETIRRLRPDVALIDIGLPSLDGYQVAQQLRSGPDNRNIFLIALTGYSQPEDRRRALAAGFDAYLVKPVKLPELSDLLSTQGRQLQSVDR